MVKNKVNEKQAQIIGQVVMFILAGLVFVLVLTYGYKSIKQFLEKSEEVSIATFQNDFVNAVEAIKRDYGSVAKVELFLPSKYSLVCIADSDPAANSGRGDFATNPQRKRMYEAWMTGSENIFLVPPASQRIRKVNGLSVDYNSNPYFCTVNKGKITLRLEGLGDRARVSPWQ